MKHTTTLFAMIAVVGASIALAAPPTDTKKPDAKKPAAKTTKVAKVTDVWTCPITGEKITDHAKVVGKPQVVGNYRVHFCCGGCPETFAKMSAKDQKAKAEVAAKKDVAKTDDADKKGKS